MVMQGVLVARRWGSREWAPQHAGMQACRGRWRAGGGAGVGQQGAACREGCWWLIQ